MERMRLGKTELMVSRSGFGAIPIQRLSFADAEKLVRKAFDNGINFFDTARGYSDSEEKLGRSFKGIREQVIIATKSGASDRATLLEHLETSLKNLQTDYIDIYQFHNPKTVPRPGDPSGLYDTVLEAKREGKIRHIGITNHRLPVAREAVQSGLFATLQFPFSSLSAEGDIGLVQECERHDQGFIAMKALSGGLITNAASTFTFLRQYPNVVPIWGIQYEWELDEFIALEKEPPALDEKMWEVIRKDRQELGGAFCRGCGYCLPCPAGIDIPVQCRVSLFVRRTPYQKYLTPEWREKMELIKNCQECGHCKSKCPYDLDTPTLLKKQLEEYDEFYRKHMG